MEVINKLGQLLNIDEDEYGIIADICKETGLHRNQVSQLLHNKAKGAKYDTLAKVCQYLIDKELVDPAMLPGALFGFAPNEFWPLLSERRRIEFCMGTRRDTQWYDELVMAADSELQAKLIRRITQYGSLQKRNGAKSKASRDGQILDQSLIAAPTREGDNEQETITESNDIYEHFESQKNDKALICLGSVKSNSVIEHLMAHCFADTTAFLSQDDVGKPSDRTCPFAIIFRDRDPPLNSCCGGQKLSRKDPGNGPGIYFEQPGGQWDQVRWNAESDGAIVFYRYHRSLRNLTMCLGGYSSRGTRFLADFLHSGDADCHLWPPAYDDGEVQIGLFVLKFTLHEGAGDHQSGSVRHEKPLHTKVYPVSGEVVTRRMRHTTKKRNKSTQADAESLTATQVV